MTIKITLPTNKKNSKKRNKIKQNHPNNYLLNKSKLQQNQNSRFKLQTNTPLQTINL